MGSGDGEDGPGDGSGAVAQGGSLSAGDSAAAGDPTTTRGTQKEDPDPAAESAPRGDPEANPRAETELGRTADPGSEVSQAAPAPEAGGEEGAAVDAAAVDAGGGATGGAAPPAEGVTGGGPVGPPADSQTVAASGASAAVPSTPSEVPEAPPVKPENAPAIILQGILSRLSALDQFSFFQAPVTEAVAPGYFNVVKRPMCFHDIREKLKGRAYRTWRQLVDDFDLICSNAVLYNRKNSKIHKAAQALNRAGKKLLQNSELEGRKAVQLLHPDGPHAAAREDEAEAAAQAAAASSLMSPSSSSSFQAAMRAEALAGAEAARLQGSIAAYDALVDELMCHTKTAEVDEGAGYSSFSDSDVEEPNPAAAAAAKPDPLLQPSLEAVTWVPFGDVIGAAAALDSKQHEETGLQKPCEGVLGEPRPGVAEQGAAGALKEVAADAEGGQQPGRDEDPSAARHSIKWRHRWLELRCRELAVQEARQQALVARLEAGPAELQPAPDQSGSPPSAPAPEGRAASAATALPQKRPSIVSTAKCRLPHRRRPRRQNLFKEAGLGEGAGKRLLEEIPFFAHHVYGEGTNSGKVEAPLALAEVVRGAGPSENDGAAVFAALELLLGRLQVLKAALPGGQRGSARVKRQPLATDLKAAHRSRSTGSLAVQRSPNGGSRGYRGAAPSAITIPSRTDEAVGSKGQLSGRKRSMSDVWDPEAAPGSLPKITDRPPVADIYTPSVRLINEAELQRRRTAVVVLREKAIAEAAASMQPGLVVADASANGNAEALLAEAVGSDGDREGSSSEETDDECYLRRHQEMEEKERAAVMERASRSTEGRRSSNTDTKDPSTKPPKVPNGAGLPPRIGSPKGA